MIFGIPPAIADHRAADADKSGNNCSGKRMSESNTHTEVRHRPSDRNRDEGVREEREMSRHYTILRAAFVSNAFVGRAESGQRRKELPLSGRIKVGLNWLVVSDLNIVQ
jgi:hypothetical protein